MGLQDHLAKITDSLSDLGTKPAKQRHGSMPATSSLSYFSDEMRETNAEVEALKKSAGHAIRVRLDLCDDGPYHTSPLDLERVHNLKGNLKENGQSAPALLRAKEGGRFEIVAGRHRKAACLELGHSEWDAVLKDIDDDAAERLTFYDNLLAPSLTDYAKYQGFAQRKKSKGFTDEQLALESGVSRQTVQRLLSFSKLPPEVHLSIQRNPTSFGGTLAEAIAPLVDGHKERVLEAIELIAANKLQASGAVKWILEKKPNTEKPTETLIRQGKATYAKVGRRAGQLTIKFNKPEAAEQVEKEILEVLKRHAQATKATR